MTALAGWENFYVIVGSSAGTLIGLQFVVITLIADMPIAQGQAQAGDAFATPTIVHFGTVLLLSAVLSAPWHGIATAAVLWGILGLSGIVYEIIVARRMRVQIVYTPEFEDWLFHFLLPFAAYATLAVSAYAARSHAGAALFLALGRRRCCCSSSAFTTPGTPSHTTSWSRNGDSTMMGIFRCKPIHPRIVKVETAFSRPIRKHFFSLGELCPNERANLK